MVDLSSTDPALKKTVMSRAHQTIVVTTPTVTSLRFCRSLIKELSEVRGGDAGDLSLVINMEGVSKANEVDPTAIAEALDFSPSMSIPYMPSLFLKHESEIAQMFTDKEGTALVSSFLPLIKGIISGKQGSGENNDQNSGIIGGFLNKLSSK